MMNSLYFKLGALAAAFAGGFWLNGTLWQAKWSERDKADALSVVAAQEAEHTKERQWQAYIQKVHDEAKKQQETIAADAAELGGTVASLREQIKHLSANNKSAGATIAELRRTSATSDLVRREMLGYCVGRIESLATAFDRSRAQGLACASAYNAIR